MLESQSHTPGAQVDAPPSSGAGCDKKWHPGDSSSNSEVQSNPFSPRWPGDHSLPLWEGREGAGMCEGENAAAGLLPLLLLFLLSLTTHFGVRIRTPSFPSSFTESFLLFTDSVRNISSVNHGSRSSPAELSSSNQHLLRERKSSAPSHSSQPTLFTFEPPLSNHMQPTLSTSAPQEYLYLHQCISRRAENAR